MSRRPETGLVCERVPSSSHRHLEAALRPQRGRARPYRARICIEAECVLFYIYQKRKVVTSITLDEVTTKQDNFADGTQRISLIPARHCPPLRTRNHLAAHSHVSPSHHRPHKSSPSPDRVPAANLPRRIHTLCALRLSHLLLPQLRRLWKPENPVWYGRARLKHHIRNPETNPWPASSPVTPM